VELSALEVRYSAKPVTLSWADRHPDRDLTYMVRYSCDDGQTRRVVAANLSQPECRLRQALLGPAQVETVRCAVDDTVRADQLWPGLADRPYESSGSPVAMRLDAPGGHGGVAAVVLVVGVNGQVEGLAGFHVSLKLERLTSVRRRDAAFDQNCRAGVDGPLDAISAIRLLD
jgi:hypothetical protein